MVPFPRSHSHTIGVILLGLNLRFWTPVLLTVGRDCNLPSCFRYELSASGESSRGVRCPPYANWGGRTRSLARDSRNSFCCHRPWAALREDVSFVVVEILSPSRYRTRVLNSSCSLPTASLRVKSDGEHRSSEWRLCEALSSGGPSWRSPGVRSATFVLTLRESIIALRLPASPMLPLLGVADAAFARHRIGRRL